MYYSLLNQGLLISAWPHTKKHCVWKKKQLCFKPWKKIPSHRPSTLPTASNEPSPLPSVIPTSSPSNEPSQSASPSVEPTTTTFQFSTNQQLRIAADNWVTDKSLAISKYGQIEDWDVERITSMEMLFCGTSEYCPDRPHTASMQSFNADLSKWKVSQVTSMKSMFEDSYQFNSNLGGWDVGNVVNMNSMFFATKFNDNVSGWNIGKVTNMGYMFSYIYQFRQNMCAWKETSASKTGMFSGTSCDYTSSAHWCFSCDD